MATEAPVAPASAPSGVQIVQDRPAPKSFPAPTREIKVSSMQPSTPRPKPADAPKPAAPVAKPAAAKPAAEAPAPVAAEKKDAPVQKSQRERIQDDLQKFITKDDAPTDPPAEVKPADPATAPEPKEKKNPWAMWKEEQKKTAELERQLNEYKSGKLTPEERKQIDERIAKSEARAKELEEEIRFVDYQKSAEFKEKYQQPYEKAWAGAMAELKEITITDPTTSEPREVTAEDMLQLVNLPLGKAREVADEMFGKFADDAMAHRKEIRRLFDAQAQAIDEAKKMGGERDRQRQEQMQNFQRTVGTEISTTWNTLNENLLKDEKNGQYFRMRTAEEGQELSPEDSAWNDALTKGESLVKEAWSSNPLDPKLTPEQRNVIVAKHLAVWNRAKAFGALKGENSRLQAKIAEMAKQLADYQATTPGSEGGSGGDGGPAPTDARSRMRAELHKFARA